MSFSDPNGRYVPRSEYQSLIRKAGCDLDATELEVVAISRRVFLGFRHKAVALKLPSLLPESLLHRVASFEHRCAEADAKIDAIEEPRLSAQQKATMKAAVPSRYFLLRPGAYIVFEWWREGTAVSPCVGAKEFKNEGWREDAPLGHVTEQALFDICTSLSAGKEYCMWTFNCGNWSSDVRSKLINHKSLVGCPKETGPVAVAEEHIDPRPTSPPTLARVSLAQSVDSAADHGEAARPADMEAVPPPAPSVPPVCSSRMATPCSASASSSSPSSSPPSFTSSSPPASVTACPDDDGFDIV